MSIGPISAAGIAPIATISSMSSTAATGAADAASSATGAGGNMATNLIDALQGEQDNADSLALQASTGGGNVGDVMIAAQEASMTTDMTVAVRNKAVDAFNSIMGMQF